MATVQLTPTYLGHINDTGIYRVDLKQSKLGAISRITIHDDGAISGGTGSHSGFDLDYVRVSSTLTDSPGVAAGLTAVDVFDFTGGVTFTPGFLQPVQPNQPQSWNVPNLIGTSGNNQYDPAKASLWAADSTPSDTGEISLGEGGSLSLLLKSALSTDGRYLYFGDGGSGSDGAYVTVSDDGTFSPPTSFVLIGTPGNDRIDLMAPKVAHLRNLNNTVKGEKGNDVISAAFGNDVLYGGTGHDKLNGRHGNDRLYGNTGNDTISGSFGDDRLYGNSGNDLVSGGPGDDWVAGNAGNDRLSGGGGKDNFLFDSRLSERRNVDRIFDFNPKDDSFYLSDSVFKGLGSGTLANPKKLKSAFFWKGEQAHDSNDRIIYDKASGKLYYDPDGTGAAAQVQFAQLSKNLKLTYHDFFVI